MFNIKYALILISLLFAINLFWFNCTDPSKPDFNVQIPAFTLFIDSTCLTPLHTGDTLCYRDTMFFILKTDMPDDIENVSVILEDSLNTILYQDSSSVASADSTFRMGSYVLTNTGYNILSISIITLETTIDTSITFEIVGLAPYLISGLPIITEITEGGTCTLSVSAGGTGQLTYTWYRNDVEITGNLNSLIFTNAQASHSGIYKCKISNIWGTISSGSTDLTVFPIGSPETPDSLRITGKNSAWILLEWNPVNGINEYRVYRDTVIYSSVGPLAVSSKTQYVDVTTEGYYYWVTAYNGTLESPKSNWVCSIDTLQNNDTTIVGPQWKTDSITIVMNEGSGYTIDLMDTCTNPDTVNPLVFEIISNTPKGIILHDSIYSFSAGHLDSGKYIDMIIASNGSITKDTMKITVTVNPVYHTLQVLSDDNGTAIVDPDKPEYRWGDTVIVSAFPNELYTFSKWLGDVAESDSTINPLNIIMDNDKSFIAKFISSDEIIIKAGTDLNMKIKEIADKALDYIRLYPEPGFYLNGSVKGEVEGKLKIIIEND